MDQPIQSISKGMGKLSPAEFDAEDLLRDREQRCWDRYFEIERTLAISGSKTAHQKTPYTSITSTISKTGIDEAFVQTLLSLAPNAWKGINSASAKVVHFNPTMQKEIEEVRHGLFIQSEKKMEFNSDPVFLTPQETYDQLQSAMDPANLHLLIDEITTPWIVLPRAYQSLTPDHIHFMPAYLEIINNETNEEVLHIFTRIVIEFLANFTIRFADNTYPRKKIICLITAGYSAMFWKNLRNPPRGFEDIRIFEHFLSWLKNSGCNEKSSGHDLEAVVQDMDEMKTLIFPKASGIDRIQKKKNDWSRFMVTLRHGCKGIDCAVRYFWLMPAGFHSSPERFSHRGMVIFSLKSLFTRISGRYDSETKRTRYYVREFLFQLEKAFSGSTEQNPLKSIGDRITTMIQTLRRSLLKVASK